MDRHRGPKKKIKLEDDDGTLPLQAGSSRTASKRLTRGYLQGMVDMPVDVLFEVCCPHQILSGIHFSFLKFLSDICPFDAIRPAQGHSDQQGLSKDANDQVGIIDVDAVERKR
jgi:hypothetical protein